MIDNSEASSTSLWGVMGGKHLQVFQGVIISFVLRDKSLGESYAVLRIKLRSVGI